MVADSASRDVTQAALDSCARLHMDRRRRFGSYLYCGLLGAFIGMLLGGLLGLLTSVPRATVIVAVLTPVPTFFAAIKLRHTVAGEESIVLYEKFLVVIGMTALILVWAGEPILIGLELVTVGTGASLVFGRLGCLRVGCCYGRPCRWGIVYGAEHESSGFPDHYVGVRLLPIQLIESVFTAFLVAACVALFLSKHSPGEVVALYFSLYGVARFSLELWRGDTERPHALGLSEAQWISVALAWAVTLLPTPSGSFMPPTLYLGVAVWLTVGAAVIAIVSRRALRPSWLKQPRRILELFDAVSELRGEHEPPDVSIATTPSGLRITYSKTKEEEHFAVSGVENVLAEDAAKVVARQLSIFVTRNTSYRLETGQADGVFHVFVRVGEGEG